MQNCENCKPSNQKTSKNINKSYILTELTKSKPNVESLPIVLF